MAITQRSLSKMGKISRKKRLRKHGFLARMQTVGGRRVLRNRRRKGRHQLVVTVSGVKARGSGTRR